MADVTLSVTVPDAFVSEVGDAFMEFGGELLTVNYKRGRFGGTIPSRGATEGLQEYSERVARKILWFAVQARKANSLIATRTQAEQSLPTTIPNVDENAFS